MMPILALFPLSPLRPYAILIRGTSINFSSFASNVGVSGFYISDILNSLG